jgi:trehalose-phosphatase
MVPTSNLPSALDAMGEIREKVADRLALFLDFDGTLSPIVADFAEARIDAPVRDVVKGLARRFVVAIVSGRGSADVRDRVGIDGLIYAGSHGQEIDMLDGSRYEHPASLSAAAALDRAESSLRHLLLDADGVVVERKPFSIAVHVRNARSEYARSLAAHVSAEIAREEGLIARRGKEIWELRPNVAWDKGKAIEHLIDEVAPGCIPVFIGDDETDEDGFRAVGRRGGLGIVVVPPKNDRRTSALYRLSDSREVTAFLSLL